MALYPCVLNSNAIFPPGLNPFGLKAFDKVDHHILLTKCDAYGIKGKIHRWLHTFLTNRTQRVRVGKHLSEEVKVASGVPQGSVLGPLLFIIFMIDITDGVENLLLGSFADDTKGWQKTSVPKGASPK